MDKMQLEVFTNTKSEHLILRNPERKFPGLLIQGDALNSLYQDAKEILEKVPTANDVQLTRRAEGLFERLKYMMGIYEAALINENYDFPYRRDLRL